MLRGVEVLRRMLVFGRIAATDVPAFQAQAQMHPGIAKLDALFANMSVCGGELDLFYMRATLSHGSS